MFLVFQQANLIQEIITYLNYFKKKIIIQVGGVYSLSFGNQNVGITMNNLYFNNTADVGGVFDIDFKIGLLILLEEIYSENYGYHYNKNKIGSAAIASLRISQDVYFKMINAISFFNWCEAKGKEFIMNYYIFFYI